MLGQPAPDESNRLSLSPRKHSEGVLPEHRRQTDRRQAARHLPLPGTSWQVPPAHVHQAFADALPVSESLRKSYDYIKPQATPQRS